MIGGWLLAGAGGRGGAGKPSGCVSRMIGGSLLAVTAGMLGAVNPCGFALLPAYLSVLIVSDQVTPGRAVVRALRCTVALTLGYVLVFGAFGLALTPVADAIQ